MRFSVICHYYKSNSQEHAQFHDENVLVEALIRGVLGKRLCGPVFAMRSLVTEFAIMDFLKWIC